MNVLQLLLFAWVGGWVVAESISPGISYAGKLQASLFSTFAAFFGTDAHRVVWKWVRGGNKQLR